MARNYQPPEWLMLVMARLALASVAVALVLALLAPASLARPGEVDSSFGTGGELMLPDQFSEIRGIATLPDGRLVVTAESGAVGRVDERGRFDESFGDRGIGWHGMSFVTPPIVQPDGRVVVVGRLPYDGTGERVGATRLNKEGEADPSYGEGGEAVLDRVPAGFSFATAFGQANGGVIVAGTVLDQERRDRARPALARLDERGRLDRSFGTDGWVVTDVPNSTAFLVAGVEQPDGRLVLAGELVNFDQPRDRPPRFEWAAIRYRADGSIDKTFGEDGIAGGWFGGGGGGLRGVEAQRDGKVLLAGSARAPDGSGDALSSLARGRADGSRDPSFGGDGLAQLPLPPLGTPGPTWMQGAHVTLLRDGKIAVTAGYMTTPAPGAYPLAGWALARVRSDGALDRSFGDSGWAATSSGVSLHRPDAITTSGDRIVVAGVVAECDRFRGALVAFRNDDDGRDAVGPAMRVCTRSVRPDEDGDIGVVVQCPMVEERCSGTETVEVPTSELGSSARRARRPLRVGSRRFKLDTALATRVPVRAGGAARKLLGSRKRTRAVVTLTARDAGGHRRTVRRSIVIRR